MLRKLFVSIPILILGFYIGIRSDSWFGVELKDQIEGFFMMIEGLIVNSVVWVYEWVLGLFSES